MTDKLQSAFSFAPPEPFVPEWKKNSRFDGSTFEAEKDAERLGRQFVAVRDLMKDGKWRTLREISSITKGPETSISARLRDLRKERCGSFQVERRRASDTGLHEYRVLPKGSQQ